MSIRQAGPTQIRALHFALLLLICLVVARTLILDRETQQERDSSEAMSRNLEALTSTKLAYRPDLILASRHSPPVPSDLFGGAQRAEVVADWRKLATGRNGRAAEWRRLGITLALFRLSGALDALRHVADRFPPPPPATRAGRLRSDRADPFGHLPVAIPPHEEIAMWRGIYGTKPLTAPETARYRAMLAQLRLGWFENVAAAQLYTHAGQTERARNCALAAQASAQLLTRLDFGNIALILMGVVGLFVLGLIWLANLAQRADTPPKAGYALPSPGTLYTPPRATPPAVPTGSTRPAGYGVPAPAATGSVAGVVLQERRRQVPFPYTALLFTFIVYLVAQEGVSLLAGLALSPFHGRLAALSSGTLLRLEQMLQILAYIPILGLPLLALRRLVRYDPHTGEPLSWRRMLAYLGFRARNPLGELGAGALGYLLVVPAVTLMGLLSTWLFARFHTPENPAALEMLAAQSGLDRLLILFVASVAAPFVEETCFRGILYSALRSRLGVWGAAALSAAIFSVVHPTLPGGFLPIWAVGTGLALVYEWRQSLLPGMVLHGIYNGMITLTIFAIFAK